MKSRSWVVLSLGFGTLLAIIALMGYAAMQRSHAIQQELVAAQESYLQTESVLRDIPADLHLAGVLARDYLLDPSHITAPLHRNQLVELRAAVRSRLQDVSRRIDREDLPLVRNLTREVEAYWDSLDPIFEWTPSQKAGLSFVFLRQQVLPKRNAVLNLAGQIGKWNEENFRQEREQLRRAQQAFESFLRNMLLFALSFGVLVALLSMHRVSVLEKRSEGQRLRAESAEEELRRLSHKLVNAQEEERKSLSRELHDAVGQMLTGLRMELANLESLCSRGQEEFARRLAQSKEFAEEALRTVRDLAMGLRPSMLDDLGLGPALEWQGRDFSRRCGVPVTVLIDGSLDGLGEPHRTCIYRVVQEALTNCAKHSQAGNIRVAVHGRRDRVSLTVQDDGVGFDSESAARSGLGLIGIQERVRELSGTVTLTSQPNRGAMLHVEIPVADASC